MKFIFMIFAILMNSAWGSRYNPTTDLNNAFGVGCLGEKTLESMRHSEALMNIMESLKDDPSCNDLYNQSVSLYEHFETIDLDNMASNHSQLTTKHLLNTRYALQVEKNKLASQFLEGFLIQNPGATQEQQDQALALFIPQSSHLNALETSFNELSLNYIHSKTYLEYEKDLEQKQKVEKLKKFVSLSDNLFTSLSASTACLENKPSLFTRMSAPVMGMASTLFTNDFGALLLGSAHLISGMSKLFRDWKYNRQISNLRDSNLSIAVGCTIESLAKHWCHAEEVKKIVDFSGRTNRHQIEGNQERELLKGIHLITQSLPSFNNWIFRISIGSSPSSTGQAGEQSAVFQRRFSFDTIKGIMDGFMNQTSVALGQLGDGSLDQKNKVIRQLLDNISGIIQSSSMNGQGSGPYQDSFQQDPTCGPAIYFYSQGRDRFKIGTDEELFLDCSTFINKKYPIVNIETHSILKISDWIGVLNREAIDEINRRWRLVIEINPDLVMANFESINASTKSSPKMFLLEAREYLLSLLEWVSIEKNPYLRILIENTSQKINQALYIITNTDRLPPGNQIFEIGNLFSPQRQTQSLGDTIKEIVKQDIDLRLSNGEISDDELREILSMSLDDGSRQLIVNHIGLDKVFEDAVDSQNITQENLLAVKNIFNFQINEHLNNLAAKSLTDPGSKRQLALYCIKTLLIPDNPKTNNFLKRGKKEKASICDGLVYKSKLNHPQIGELKYDEVKKWKYPQRVCSLFEYQTRVSFYELRE